MLASRLLPSLLLAAGANAAADDDVHPALDLITRNYGAAATASFDLSISAAACPTDAEHGCFVLSQKGAKVSVAAGTMADLTYGIGYYARFSCGLTVGWTRGGGSNTAAAAWPCHTGALPQTTVARAVPFTYEDNVCTHSYSYVWYGEKEWTAHIDWMALQGVNVFLAMTGQEEM